MTPRSAADRKTQWNQVTKRYDCIVPNCDARVKSFVTYEEAKAHIRQHAYVLCDQCDHRGPKFEFENVHNKIHLRREDRRAHCEDCLKAGLFAGFTGPSGLVGHQRNFCFFRLNRPRDPYDRPHDERLRALVAIVMAASEQPRIESASQIVSPPHPVTPPRPPFNLPPIQLSASDEDWNEPEAHHRQPNFGFDLPARRQAYIPANFRNTPVLFDPDFPPSHPQQDMHRYSLTHRQRKVYGQDFARSAFEHHFSNF